MRDLFSLLPPWPIGQQTIVWLASRQSRTVLSPVPTPLGREVCCGRSLSPPFLFFFFRAASRHRRGGRAGTRWRISLPGTLVDVLSKRLIRNRSTVERRAFIVPRRGGRRRRRLYRRGTINEAITNNALHAPLPPPPFDFLVSKTREARTRPSSSLPSPIPLDSRVERTSSAATDRTSC